MLRDFNSEFETPTPSVEVLTERVSALLSQAGTYAVVAEEAPTGFGLVTLRTNVWSGTVALLDELYVEPTGRSQGVGTELLALALDEARRRGATEFEVEVDEPDEDAQRFYARHGLSVVDPESGDHAFVARRPLDHN